MHYFHLFHPLCPMLCVKHPFKMVKKGVDSNMFHLTKYTLIYNMYTSKSRLGTQMNRLSLSFVETETTLFKYDPASREFCYIAERSWDCSSRHYFNCVKSETLICTEQMRNSPTHFCILYNNVNLSFDFSTADWLGTRSFFGHDNVLYTKSDLTVSHVASSSYHCRTVKQLDLILLIYKM